MLNWLLGMFAARSITKEITDISMKSKEPENQSKSVPYTFHFVTLKDRSVIVIGDPLDESAFPVSFARHSGSWHYFNGNIRFTTHGRLGEHVGLPNQKTLEEAYQKTRSENGVSDSNR